MYKQAFLSVVLFVLVSCGQDASHAPQPGKTDSSKQAPKAIDSTKEDRSASLKHGDDTSTVKVLPLDTAQFVPKGYSILDTTSGDLNRDPYPDMVMVLKKNGEDTSSDITEHPEKRPLLILIRQPDGHLTLAARSDNAVLCHDGGGAMGDPFTDIVIKNGYFSVEHYGGSSLRWSRTTTFSYSPADNYWFLHKDVSESFDATESKKVDRRIYTTKNFGKVRFDAFNIYKN